MDNEEKSRLEASGTVILERVKSAPALQKNY